MRLFFCYSFKSIKNSFQLIMKINFYEECRQTSKVLESRERNQNKALKKLLHTKSAKLVWLFYFVSNLIRNYSFNVLPSPEPPPLIKKFKRKLANAKIFIENISSF